MIVMTLAEEAADTHLTGSNFEVIYGFGSLDPIVISLPSINRRNQSTIWGSWRYNIT